MVISYFQGITMIPTSNNNLGSAWTSFTTTETEAYITDEGGFPVYIAFSVSEPSAGVSGHRISADHTLHHLQIPTGLKLWARSEGGEVDLEVTAW